MLPDYATILIALASAGLAGFGAAYLQARHERRENLWDRRISAADDLATKLAQAAIGAGEATQKPSQAPIEELRRLVDEALAASARVDLLFGVESPTVAAANRALGAYHQVIAHLASDPPDVGEADNFINEAAGSLGVFTAVAGEVIRRRRT